MPLDLSDYQPVEERLAQFWAKHPNGRVHTQAERIDDKQVIFSARVWRDMADPEPAATGYAQETIGQGMVNKTSWVENCETSAIGRALANLGFAPKGARASREEMQKATRNQSPAAPADRDSATQVSVPTPPAERAAGDAEHRRAHQAKSTLDIKEPDRALITDGQWKKLLDLAGPDGYRMSGDQLRDVIQEVTGQRTKKIPRYQFDAVLAAVDLAGKGIVA